MIKILKSLNFNIVDVTDNLFNNYNCLKIWISLIENF